MLGGVVQIRWSLVLGGGYGLIKVKMVEDTFWSRGPGEFEGH